MTNEETVTAIQGGQTDLIEPLWEHYQPLVRAMARAWKRAFENHTDFDAEDLVQQGWFALLDAIRWFKPDNEHACFLTLFRLCLKRQFKILIGIQTSKRDAAFFASLSLDSPIKSDEPDGGTFCDTIPDPASMAPFEAIEDASEREQVRSTMDTVAGEILTDKQREIYEGLLMELRVCDIADDSPVTRARLYQRKKDMLGALRGDPRILQLWLDVTDQRETVADIADRYMSQVGAGAFHETGMSSVERAVMTIIKNEDTLRQKQVALKDAVREKLHAANAEMVTRAKQRQRKQIFDDLSAFERGRSERMAGV